MGQPLVSKLAKNPPHAAGKRRWCLVARIGVIRFVRGDPSASLRVTYRINVMVACCPLCHSDILPTVRATAFYRCHSDIVHCVGSLTRQPPLLGVILSVAKNLNCYAYLCNQALAHYQQTSCLKFPKEVRNRPEYVSETFTPEQARALHLTSITHAGYLHLVPLK